MAKKVTVCKGCGQPMLPPGEVKRPNEYDHATGCPLAPPAVVTKEWLLSIGGRPFRNGVAFDIPAYRRNPVVYVSCSTPLINFDWYMLWNDTRPLREAVQLPDQPTRETACELLFAIGATYDV